MILSAEANEGRFDIPKLFGIAFAGVGIPGHRLEPMTEEQMQALIAAADAGKMERARKLLAPRERAFQ